VDVTTRPPGCGEDVAAFALGALPDEDARRFRAHLEECELCRADLDALRPAVDALPSAVEPVTPPPELKRRIMAVVEAEARERRRADEPARPSWFERLGLRRPLPALVAAGALLLAGVGVGISVTQDSERTVTGTVVGAPSARAELQIEGDRGTLVVDDMPAPPSGRVWQVWTKHGSDPPQPTDALFTPARDGRASVTVPGGMGGIDQVLVTHEPDGGSMEPTVAPSIVIDA
jgi:anti-sigma-K factor RskA